MTAAERLQQLSGLAGVSAAVMLLSIGTGATAGDALTNYSALPTGTAAEHLLADRTSSNTQISSGPAGGNHKFVAPPSAPDEFHDAVRRSRIKRDDEELLLLVNTFVRTLQ